MIAVIAIMLYRSVLSRSEDVFVKTYAHRIAALLNALQIQVLNFMYEKVSQKLTDMENHKTSTSYQNSMNIKSFIFKMINS